MAKETLEKARKFCKEVRTLGEKYGLSFFFVTEGASTTQNKGNDAVENARNAHKKWEVEHGFNPTETWEEGNK